MITSMVNKGAWGTLSMTTATTKIQMYDFRYFLMRRHHPVKRNNLNGCWRERGWTFQVRLHWMIPGWNDRLGDMGFCEWQIASWAVPDQGADKLENNQGDKGYTGCRTNIANSSNNLDHSCMLAKCAGNEPFKVTKIKPPVLVMQISPQSWHMRHYFQMPRLYEWLITCMGVNPFHSKRIISMWNDENNIHRIYFVLKLW